MNTTIAALRGAGSLIVHAPAGCMGFYSEHPARLRALRAPRAAPPRPADWNDPDPAREPALPQSLADPGPCSCDSAEPCNSGGPPWPWTRQIDSISIAPDDAITDDGDELFALLGGLHIDDVIVMGVHTNLCVLGRPYGIRQLVYWGKRPVLCRDLTDAFHRDPRGHAWGTEHTIAHIEQYWCPAISSVQILDNRTVSPCLG
jgi:nicotinamidase-related amidase